ncbi:MAG: hypothetical protein HYR60_14205 [Acidobacteria bacterium]|nr:hypothetical protein [Acidobacteriota bacterium]
MIQSDLREQQGCLTKATFDSIMTWGFGSASIHSETDIREATRKAFCYLRESCIAEAARALVQLREVGISRASKVLALSDQDELGIYDSRSAHGLSDLRNAAGCRIIAIPPGRVVRGDVKTPNGFCVAFEEYAWVLQHFRDLAERSKVFGAERVRVADLEMAFFARSRTGAIALSIASAKPPAHLRSVAELDEESAFWTLGPGKKAKPFWVTFKDASVTVLTGTDGKTACDLDQEQIAACLKHFGHDWFLLSNSKTPGGRDPNGLGEYFFRNFGSPVFASHFAALWVHQRLLEQEPVSGAIRLRVVPEGQERLR